MPDDSPALKQGDIEELLRQAQMASGVVPDGSAAQPTGAVPVNAGAAAASPLPTSAAAQTTDQSTTAASATIDPPRPGLASSRPAGQNIGDDVQFLLAQAEQAIASVEQPSEPNLAG